MSRVYTHIHIHIYTNTLRLLKKAAEIRENPTTKVISIKLLIMGKHLIQLPPYSNSDVDSVL